MDLSLFHTLGCLVLAWIPVTVREGGKSFTRLKSRTCALVGYLETSDGFRLYDLKHRCVVKACPQHCVVHEGEYPFKNSLNWTAEQLAMPRHFCWPSVGNLTKEESSVYASQDGGWLEHAEVPEPGGAGGPGLGSGDTVPEPKDRGAVPEPPDSPKFGGNRAASVAHEIQTQEVCGGDGDEAVDSPAAVVQAPDQLVPAMDQPERSPPSPQMPLQLPEPGGLKPRGGNRRVSFHVPDPVL